MGPPPLRREFLLSTLSSPNFLLAPTTTIMACATLETVMPLLRLLQVHCYVYLLVEMTTYWGGGGGRGGYSAFFLALSPCDFFGRLWLWSLVDLCPA